MNLEPSSGPFRVCREPTGPLNATSAASGRHPWPSRLAAQDSRPRVPIPGSTLKASRFKVQAQDPRSKLQGQRFRGPSSNVQATRLEVRDSRFKAKVQEVQEVQGSRSEVQVSRSEVQGSRSKIQGQRFKVHGPDAKSKIATKNECTQEDCVPWALKCKAQPVNFKL